MTLEEIRRIIAVGNETRSIEFKSACQWTDPARSSKIKATALGMANIRDGGLILVGMREDPSRPGHHILDPLSELQRATFQPDEVIPQINAHAVPHVSLTVEQHEVEPDCYVIALEVQQFHDIPVLCSRAIVAGANTVVAPVGALLTRSRRTPETTIVQSPEDFREIVELAGGRALERYFRLRAIEAAAEKPTDEQLFDEQLGPLRS